MTWREVLQAKGWQTYGPRFGAESWTLTHDGERWEIMLVGSSKGVYPAVWRGGTCLEELGCHAVDFDAAFAALMAKPIGPGRVAVGVLLGVVE